MAYEIELTYPVQDEQLHDKESLLQAVRGRLSIVDVLNLEDCDYPREVSALTTDIRILMQAALDKEDAEKVIQCGREGLEEAVRFAETIAVAVEVDDLHPLKIKKGAIFSLMYGLREMLERIEAQGSDREDNLDPLSLAALEKTIGLDGLRRLHNAIDAGPDAVLNHIEYYVENQEGSVFMPRDGDGPDEFEERRATREKIDPAKPLGFYDQNADPTGVDDEDLGPDDDASMLLDSIMVAVPEDDLRRLRIAAFDHHDELTQVLARFLETQSDQPDA